MATRVSLAEEPSATGLATDTRSGLDLVLRDLTEVDGPANPALRLSRLPCDRRQEPDRLGSEDGQAGLQPRAGAIRCR